MKNIAGQIALLTLALALLLTQAALAEPSEALQGIYDALLAEGSDYSTAKADSAEYDPGIQYEETLDANGITITVSGSEYSNGSWTFAQDGDELTSTFAVDDYNGAIMAIYMANAVGDYYGMNTDVISGYINGIGVTGIEGADFSMTDDEAAGTTDVRINIAGPWEMKELDGMVFDENSLYYGPLDDEFTSLGGAIGKLMMVANGSADDLTLLVGENGGLDDLAYRSIINIVSTLQPKGWEGFTANYTGLAEAEGEGWSVRLDVGEAEVAGIIDDARAGDSFALIHFGA